MEREVTTIGALKEYLDDQFKILGEGMQLLQDMSPKVHAIEEDMDWIKPRISSIQDTLKIHSGDITEIKQHIGLPITK